MSARRVIGGHIQEIGRRDRVYVWRLIRDEIGYAWHCYTVRAR